MRKWLYIAGASICAAVIAGAFTLIQRQESTPQVQTATTTLSSADDSFNKQLYSLTQSESLWVIVNKNHPLPAGYAPQQLVTPNVLLRLGGNDEQMHVSSVIAPALEALFEAASQDGIILKLSSAYRSEALQSQFYNTYKAKDGEAAADRYSARPGTSEHQTGLSADIIPANDMCHLEVCFGELPEGKWLATHAHEHGFIIRYRAGKESSTGYQYEPWHIRYVGPDLAAKLKQNDQTMEEFFVY